MTLKLNRPDLLKSKCLIDGQWIDADSSEEIQVLNPANGETVGHIAKCGTAETRRAIEAAEHALLAWQATPAATRSACLRSWYNLLIENQDDLAAILTAEMGKPLAEARGEIVYGAGYVEWFAEEAKRIYGDVIPAPDGDKRIVCIRQPVGVVGCITPWNFPNAMLARKLAPALAAGCTVVCKPANETPLSAYAMAALAIEAGIPAGVINIVSGNTSEIGAEITSHPAVRKVSFTGSTEVGKILIQQCASTVKRTSMELGGNAPFIVFDDADIDAAVEGAMISKFRNAGQTCVCTNRLLVQDGIAEEFSSRLTERVNSLKVGEGTQADVAIGPLINDKASNNVLSMIDDAVSNGAKVLAGGKQASAGERFVEPTVLSECTSNMRIFKDEIFGPVAPLFRFSTEEEAISMANDTEVGLACYFYSRDVGRIWRVAEALEYGIVGINEGAISNPAAPFGGVKESGQGREGSKYGLDDYTEIKYMCMGGISST